MLARVARRIQTEISEMRRVFRATALLRGRVLVGYTKVHPIYTELFESQPPHGYTFYHRTTRPWLAPIDRWIWSRVRLLHRDAGTARDESLTAPEVVECEGIPADGFLTDERVRHVFVESEHAGRYHLSKGAVTLLRPAIAPAVRRSTDPDAGQPLLLLAVGHGGMVKGFDVVVRAFDVIRNEFDVRLAVIGSVGHNWEHYPEISREAYDAVNFPAILAKIAHDSRIELRATNRSDLMNNIYPSAAVYLHLARMETFGFSVLEAMSHALPVIATKINAIPEMVRHEETGLLIDPGEVDMNSPIWAERVMNGAVLALRRLLGRDEMRSNFGAAGRERVTRAFSLEWKKRELARVYDRALSEVSSVASPRSAPMHHSH